MCFTGWCQWEKYSYAKEDCICKKPSYLPCPMDMSEEEYDDYDEDEYIEEDDNV